VSEEALRQPDEALERVSSAPSSNGPLCSHTSTEHALEQIIPRTFQPKLVRFLLHVPATGVMNGITAADAADKRRTQ
jgi:hypothetical protein